MKARLRRLPAPFFMVHRPERWTWSKSKCARESFGPQAGRLRRNMNALQPKRRTKAGSAAVWQARLIMLIMINIAQLWILAATVDAALGRHFSVLIPLVIASGACFLITLSIIRWWRPTSRSKTSSGYVRSDVRNEAARADRQ